MSVWTEREKTLAFIAGILLLFAGFLLFIDVPITEYTKEKRAEAEALRREVKSMEIMENRQAAEGFAAELAERERCAKRALPDDEGQGDFLVYLEAQAAMQGVELLGITPLPAEEGTKHRAYPVRVRMKADYFSLLEFLKKCTAERFVTIRKAEVAVEPLSNQLSCDLEFITYTLK